MHKTIWKFERKNSQDMGQQKPPSRKKIYYPSSYQTSEGNFLLNLFVQRADDSRVLWDSVNFRMSSSIFQYNMQISLRDECTRTKE